MLPCELEVCEQHISVCANAAAGTQYNCCHGSTQCDYHKCSVPTSSLQLLTFEPRTYVLCLCLQASILFVYIASGNMYIVCEFHFYMNKISRLRN